eukprot:505151-Amphidinium_carterae.1
MLLATTKRVSLELERQFEPNKFEWMRKRVRYCCCQTRKATCRTASYAHMVQQEDMIPATVVPMGYVHDSATCHGQLSISLGFGAGAFTRTRATPK